VTSNARIPILNARIPILGAVALLMAWAVLLALTASPTALLFAAPFFMLAGLLLTGGHPGADLIERVARFASLRRSSTFGSVPDFGWVTGFRLLRNDLISVNLAGRAPPFRPV